MTIFFLLVFLGMALIYAGYLKKKKALVIIGFGFIMVLIIAASFIITWFQIMVFSD